VRTICLIILSLIVTNFTQAQPVLPAPPSDIARGLEEITKNFRANRTIAPGVIVRIYNPGNWEWSFADGVSNISTNSPATTDLIFRSASISKIFCATAILQLADRGRLNLNDNISKWLAPEFVSQIEESQLINIRSLLNHTSDLNEPQSGTTLAGNFLGKPEINYRDSIFQIIGSQGDGPFSFGQFYYSNANYNVLAEIVKNVSGISYQQYILENIIQPIGLTDTYLDSLPVQRGFNGYVPCNSLPNCSLPNVSTLIDYSQANVGWGYGTADISSTSKDLIRFYYALQNAEILPRRWVDSMTAKPIDASNSFSNKLYGYGTMLFQKDAKTIAIGHTGTAASNANVLCQLKPSNIYVVFSFNIIRANREAFLEELDNFISSGTKPEPPGPDPDPDPDPDPASSFSIYPNPARGQLNIKLNDLSPVDNYQVQIYNTTGQLIYQSNLPDIINPVNTQNWANGIYFVKVIRKGMKPVTRKIIVE
jgi:D-alanyl-D-alanine carboxypeptidase